MGKMSDTVVYFHRELPPLDADPISEHVLEATSARVPGTIAHRDDLWRVCYEDLMRQTRLRLAQEVERLGGHYARVVNETVDTCHDDAKGEAWLRGRFDYVLYQHRAAATEPTVLGHAPRNHIHERGN
jgi:hypothetical protein